MSGLERAIGIAARAHEGQVDKAGEPYILHPLRVMLRMETEDERIAAVLHDVVEDTNVTLDELRSQGFPEAVLEAIRVLTHGPNPTEEEYFAAVRRAAAHPIARRVKRADLEDNLDMSRIATPTERDHKRMERYRRALNILDGDPTG